MGTIYAIANQKGGVGKTTTAVNVGACIAEAGYETLLVDVDPQANATVGLGQDRGRVPGLYQVLTGTSSVREAIVETTVEHLRLLPAGAGLAGASVELPRLEEGFERSVRECLAPVREEFRYIMLDCPPSLGPLTVSALVAADSVIVPVQTEYFALEGLARAARDAGGHPARAEPQADRRGDALDDARWPHATGAGRRERGTQALPRARVRDGHPAQRPRRARPRATGCRLPTTIPTAPGPAPTSSWPKRSPLVAEPRRGMGKGLAAILAVLETPVREREELRELPVELIVPNPRQPRRSLDEEALRALAESLGERGLLQPVLYGRERAAPMS